jgi:chromate transport protein ChrA
VSTFLTLPKQIILVYLGVLLVEEQKDSLVKNIVFGITFVITIVLAVWIYYKMRAIKKLLLEEQANRKALRDAAFQSQLDRDFSVDTNKI